MKKKMCLNIALMFAGSLGLASLSAAQDYPTGNSAAGNTSIQRIGVKTYESFEGGGWNAGRAVGSTPGMNKNLPKSFRFTQFQGPHSFKAVKNPSRVGTYSGKLHWKHGDPAKWNGDPDIIDNQDRKAMFHGSNASSNSATIWYGFSAYFPSNGTKMKDGEEALFFQLHGAPDQGEPGRNPPIALNIAADGFNLDWGWDARRFSTDLGGQGRDGVHVSARMDSYKDRWVDFVIQVRSNPKQKNGFVKMWIDGEQKVNQKNIQLGYNDNRGIYPSWGWYLWGKNASRNLDAIMYIDELRMVEHANASYFDVAPGFFANKKAVEAVEVKGPNANYKLAASEGETVDVKGTMNVAYGANGDFHFAYNQTKDLECSNRTFGDPIAKVEKNCFVRSITPEKPSKPAASSCIKYKAGSKQEISLSKTSCVDLPMNLRGKTLQVRDSDNAKCDFRGTVKAVNGGTGSLKIDSNYVSSISLTGKRLKFNATNSCKNVKIRIF